MIIETIGSRASARVPPPVRVALLCLLLAIVASAVLRHETRISGDGRFYERMAIHPSGAHNFPYAYRVGLPWLVHVLPFSPVVSFTLLAWLAIGAGAGAMYALLRAFKIESRLAAALSAGFALAPPLLVVLLRHGRSVDPATILILTLGCLLIVRRSKLALAATMLVGVSVHESTLFLIPLAYAIWARRPLDREALRDAVLVSALPIVLYVVLRTQIATAGRQYIPGYAGPFLKARFDIVKQGLAAGNWQRELRRVVAAFGPLWLLAPLALRNVSFARRGLVLVALCLISMTFAFDWGRIIFFAAPVVYVAAAKVIQNRRQLALATIIAVFALDLGYAVYMQTYGVTHGLDGDPAVNSVPVY